MRIHRILSVKRLTRTRKKSCNEAAVLAGNNRRCSEGHSTTLKPDAISTQAAARPAGHAQTPKLNAIEIRGRVPEKRRTECISQDGNMTKVPLAAAQVLLNPAVRQSSTLIRRAGL